MLALLQYILEIEWSAQPMQAIETLQMTLFYIHGLAKCSIFMM